MGDMGRSCAEAQIMAQHAALGNLERRKSWCGFLKTLECEKWVRFLYNYAAVLHAPTFATSPLHLPPQPRAPPFAFTRASTASPNLDLRNGAEERKWQHEEGGRWGEP